MSGAYRTALAAALVAINVGPVAQNLRPASDLSVFRSGVELVTLHVTVTDRSHQYLSGLAEEEFRIFENGRQQDVRFFQPSGLPLALTVLLDTSSSVQHVLPEFQQAAHRFIDDLGAADIASVITFGDTVHVVQPFTADRSGLTAAIAGARARGGTRLYTGIYIGLHEFGRTLPDPLTKAPRRPTMVVLSDGDDTSSLIGFEDVLELAARSDVAIYTIRLGRTLSPGRGPGESEFVLRRLAEATGARAFFPQKGYELRDVVNDIRTELSNQYALAYQPDAPRANGQFRSLAVLVQRPGAVARTRPGYFAGRK